MEINSQLFLLAVSLAAVAGTSIGANAQPTADCPDRCGDLSIPFPFGTKEGCYLNKDFLITCNASNNYEAFLGETNVTVLNISLEGQLRISTSPACDCYNSSGNSTISTTSTLIVDKFPLSYTENKFTAVGCDTVTIIQGLERQDYATGCISYCGGFRDVVNGSCIGMGCCQTFIPKDVLEFEVSIYSFFNHSSVWDFNPCSYAFVVEANAYNFSTLDLADLRHETTFPVVLDWAIGNETCDDARKNHETYACKDIRSICYDSDNGPGYLCNCSEGYSGNPYLVNGCKDVNECEIPSLNKCTDICLNTAGNYTCSCPKGYHGDGRKDGSGCSSTTKSRTGVITGTSIGLVVVFAGISCFILVIQRRSQTRLRKEFFKQNGGFLLQKLLTNKSSTDTAKIFSEEALKKATNNFNKSMVIGQGGYGVVYKGILSDERVVAIKRSKAIDRTQIEQFVNEVIVLSQIHHPNVVKLLGCCLETSVPLLVYEFISNSTLFHHLHDKGCAHTLPWQTRLRMAKETATALAYMHSMQIIHRDVKSANILLDDEFTAKVSDFGVSRLVPFDQEQISTLVQGTLGYMDPEYFQSGILTEKSDVYSFGVVLVELLTGKKAICSDCEEKSLALYFISSLRGGRLFEILEDRVKQEGNAKQLKRVADIARSCLRLEGEQRPTMKKVVEDLEMIRSIA
ncbi:wall-associated receptor kinase 2 [Manihot esculenta]|uniref:Protein kinase domain-containing protein n=1 Tax=Manihot esculenta TaxID=3983 RepID=A0A2C9WES3_MANES|nr:wall-associated receptor kinase 2 [Manihot esculenta]OAY58366.1 hypothetical protein MANES_02G171800v8 [Manihot esculenta]